MHDYFLMVMSAIFVNNIVLAQYLGNCPFLGCSKDRKVAMGMGGAVVFVAFMASVITWLIQRYALTPLGLGYLQTIVFILVIASLVQFVEMFLKKVIPPLYTALGIFLPLITTNCAVMGIALLVQRQELTFTEAVVFSLASGAGFMLALVVLSAIRERLLVARMPKAMEGTAAGLVMAGLMSLAFFAFQGMI
ncbi:electron transport complex protein RnfA [Desulfohalovibrio reitneri]|uniref:electron transport complex protein RnfA n=1 Tax=Desulfohalovibrio reitneri TaxID=1307759 RepID=UPI0004A6D8D1|nr:RnfABCDGE type electron transport complex subunit A [Desulfohalovibrio reitneri]